MTIERAWIGTSKKLETWKEITKDRAQRELANQYGDNAIEKLANTKDGLKTRFAHYRIV